MNYKKKNKKQSSPKSKKRKSNKKSSNSQKQESSAKSLVLAFMKKHSAKSFTSKQVGSSTGLWTEMNNPKIKSIMDQLAKSGKISYEEKGRYKYQPESEGTIMTGVIEITRSGMGFLLVEEGDDVLIARENVGKALNKDTVKIKLLNRRGGKKGRKEGVVLEIVHRARTQFVGTVEEGVSGTFFLLADDPKINTDFFISKDHLKGAKDGEKVLAKLLNWDKRSPEVEVLEVLGEAGEHNTEMHAILLQYGFQPEFSREVEAEAEQIPEKISRQEIAKRRDMREITTFTIDPTDAKDFDDALSIQQLENGNYEVGIHIADVSHYVVPGTELDKEAFNRATSVYLVDRTVPMLPEKLSNKVCSLRPQEEKLTYSVVVELNENAKVVNKWIGRTVIYSDHRFDYDGAQAVIEGTSEGPFKEEVLQLQKLASKLREKRMGAESIEFHSNEVKFVLDDDGKPLRVIKKEMKDSNHLIEDFMLLANRIVAAHIHGLFSNPPLPSVYRIHDRPNQEKLSKLQQFVGHFGYDVNFEENEGTSDKLNNLLRKVQGTPEQNVIETIAIRSMAKAVYSTKNIGHFGLGFQYYSHFTSPIRRYPDLMIHRLLTVYHNKQYKENQTVLEAQCKHCSDRERTAAEAERASIKYKQVEFLEDKIGKPFNGLISGIIESGFFVELDENSCEGFVPVRTLEDDYYVYEEENYQFVGKDTGMKLRLGDPVKVEVSGTDLKRRTVDMILIQKLEPEITSS